MGRSFEHISTGQLRVLPSGSALSVRRHHCTCCADTSVDLKPSSGVFYILMGFPTVPEIPNTFIFDEIVQP